MLHGCGLLPYLLPEAEQAVARGGDSLLGSLSRLDEHRNAGLATPEQLTNPLLMGSLLVPLGVPLRRVAVASAPPRRQEGGEAEPPRDDVAAEIAALGGEEEDAAPTPPSPPPPLVLPFARRDLERLRLILLAQRRLREVHGPASVRRLLAGKLYFEEAVRWLEIHGGPEGRELAAHWRGLELVEAPFGARAASEGPHGPEAERAAPAEAVPPTRRRRRRRRRRGPRAEPAGPA